jgi:hypothetical protein
MKPDCSMLLTQGAAQRRHWRGSMAALPYGEATVHECVDHEAPPVWRDEMTILSACPLASISTNYSAENRVFGGHISNHRDYLGSLPT